MPAVRLRFVEAAAAETGLPDASRDAAVARLLFQHLPDPDAAAREALRVLRRGGTLVVIDIDAALSDIAQPQFPDVAGAYAKAARLLQAARGGNRVIGRRLWRILVAAGFADVRLDAFAYHSDALGLAPFRSQLDPSQLLPALESGYITPAEYDAAHDACRRFFECADAYVLMIGLVASARRPAVLPVGT